MSDYRRDFYARYRSSHVEHRDLGGTAQAHARRFPIWDRLIAPHLPENRDAVVLDCGCGEGYIVSWLQARGYRRAGGIDASPEEVTVARSLGLPVECSEIAPALAARSGAVDFLILRNVLEHLYKSEVVGMLSAARTALRPGGTIWIQVPNAESPFGARLRYADFTHELAFTQDSISQVLRVTGFSDVRVSPVRMGFRGLRGMLWKAMEAFYKLMLTAELGKGRYIVTQDLCAAARVSP
jgi:2-polyprenyl-3-methyl-5-hydroxy-6-metoxy-1,4-benzoquinol methylase